MAFYTQNLKVEAHVFNGSSTGVGQVTKWMELGSGRILRSHGTSKYGR